MGALFPDRRPPHLYRPTARKGLPPFLAGLLAMAAFMGSSFVFHLAWRFFRLRQLDYPLVAYVEWLGFALLLILPAILFIRIVEMGRSSHAGILFLAWACLVAIWIAAWSWRLYFIIDWLYPHWPGYQQYLTGALLMAFLGGAGLWLVLGPLWVGHDPNRDRGPAPDDWSENAFDLWQAGRSRDRDIDLDF